MDGYTRGKYKQAMRELVQDSIIEDYLMTYGGDYDEFIRLGKRGLGWSFYNALSDADQDLLYRMGDQFFPRFRIQETDRLSEVEEVVQFLYFERIPF